MATVATAEVRIIADTRRFVPDLRRKLRAAFATLGNQMGDEIVRRIDRRITQRLNTVMSQAARTSGQAFTREFNQALGRAGLSDALREQLGGAPAQRGARRAGDAVANAFGDNLKGTLGRLSDDALDAISFQSAIADAGRAGADTAQAFADNLRDGIRNDIERRLAGEIADIIEGVGNGPQIPAVFRRMGNEAGRNLAEGAAEEIDDSLTATLGRLFQRLGTRQARNSGRNAGTAFGRAFTSALRSIPSAFGQLLNSIVVRPLGGLANIVGEMSSELLSMAGQALAVVALLEALSGLLFALPAATAIAGAGIAAIIVPLRGTGDAFAAASGDAEEFEEALKGLTPEAASVAREFRAIAPALRDLRLRAQAAFFGALDGAITDIADNLLGPLSDGLEAASGGLGRVIDQIAEFLSQAETADTVNAVFAALTGIFDALAESTQPFLEGMRILVDEFIPEVEDFEGPLSRIGDRFRDWAESVTESGAAMEAFERGQATLDKIFRIVQDISGIFDAMFDAAESVGVDALGAVADAIADIRAEFESIDGQKTLGSVFDALSRIADVVSDIFGALFDNLAELAPDIAELFEEIGPPIEELLDGLTDGIQELLDSGGRDFFKELAEALAEIDWKLIGRRLGELLGQIAPVIDDLGLAINIVLHIVDAIIELVTFLNDLFSGTTISSWTKSIKDWFNDVLHQDEVKEWIKETDKNIAEFFTETLPQKVEDGFAAAIEALLNFSDDFAEAWHEFWDGLGSSVGAGLEAAVEVIGTQLGAALGIEGDFAADFDLDWSALWDGLVAKVGEALGGIGESISSGLASARDNVVNWASGVRADWTNFWTGLLTSAIVQLVAIRDAVSGRLAEARSTVSGWISGVRSAWTTFWSGLATNVQNGLSNVRTRVSDALSSVTSAFSTMYTNVRGVLNKMVGFVSGIVTSIQNLASRIAGYVSSAVSAASRLSGIDLNPFANGGIVYGPTAALIGEAGPEVVIPLTRPQRAVELVQQSGLLQLLAAQGAAAAPGAATAGPGGPPVEVHVHSQTADPHQVARHALRILERRLGGRGLERIA